LDAKFIFYYLENARLKHKKPRGQKRNGLYLATGRRFAFSCFRAADAGNPA
jgi:hypothetical protein